MDLQTSSQRLSLCSNVPTPQLVPEETISSVIHHEVKEMGTHMYVVSNFKHIPSRFFLDWFVKFLIRPLQEYQCHLESFTKSWY